MCLHLIKSNSAQPSACPISNKYLQHYSTNSPKEVFQAMVAGAAIFAVAPKCTFGTRMPICPALLLCLKQNLISPACCQRHSCPFDSEQPWVWLDFLLREYLVQALKESVCTVSVVHIPMLVASPTSEAQPSSFRKVPSPRPQPINPPYLVLLSPSAWSLQSPLLPSDYPVLLHQKPFHFLASCDLTLLAAFNKSWS